MENARRTDDAKLRCWVDLAVDCWYNTLCVAPCVKRAEEETEVCNDG